MNCAEILRAEYKSHPAFSDARYKPPGSAVNKTLTQFGVSERTYYAKLCLAKPFIVSKKSQRAPVDPKLTQN